MRSTQMAAAFLALDLNRDGRVGSAEWAAWLARDNQ